MPVTANMLVPHLSHVMRKQAEMQKHFMTLSKKSSEIVIWTTFPPYWFSRLMYFKTSICCTNKTAFGGKMWVGKNKPKRNVLQSYHGARHLLGSRSRLFWPRICVQLKSSHAIFTDASGWQAHWIHTTDLPSFRTVLIHVKYHFTAA